MASSTTAPRKRDVLRCRVDGYECCVAFSLANGETRRLIRTIERPGATQPGVLGGRAPVWRHDIPSVGQVLIKEYRRGGLLRLVRHRHYLRSTPTRPEREFHILRQMHAAGLQVPEPVACLSRGGLFYRGWLATRLIEGDSLADVAASCPEAALASIYEFTQQVNLLIANGIAHVDLHPGNVMVGPNGDVHLLDFDRAAVTHDSREAMQEQYIGRWHRAVTKHGLPRVLAERFADHLSGRSRHGHRRSRQEGGRRREVAPLDSPRRPELPSKPSIGIVLLGSLGDVARGLAVPSLIKRQRPDSRITWVVDARWQDLVRMHPAVDRLVVFPQARTWSAFQYFLSELQAERYDVVLDLQRILKSGVCSLLSRSRRRVGFHRSQAKELNHLFNTEEVGRYAPGASKLAHYLEFPARLGIRAPEAVEFGLENVDNSCPLPSELRARSQDFVGVVVGSSWPSKNWCTSAYVDLVERLLHRTTVHVALLGDVSHRAVATTVVESSRDRRVIDLVGRTSLPELVATLRAARASVGPDSGPAHVAAAVGTPFVGLYGPTSFEWVAPYSCEHLAVRSPVSCSPCNRRVCLRRDATCMMAISADMVWEKLEPLLQ